ncbi:Uu.00g137880.m01.CDS01 [Anthostomella pinea]|uniref:Uu.00g137880.m01.CDS01 n=1 Tax=Anthostomella pinea TaxID=933095 RepID=A0AAI8YL43_9PEZI|nr:Uu.00g137880.m01.CDS01 [Anthostomella pinea]
MFLPLFDTFDPTTCAKQDDETTDWIQRERDIVRKVVTQFQVFELLARLESPAQTQRHFDIELDPEDALYILQANRPPCR